jgi:hypothetical protein
MHSKHDSPKAHLLKWLRVVQSPWIGAAMDASIRTAHEGPWTADEACTHNVGRGLSRRAKDPFLWATGRARGGLKLRILQCINCTHTTTCR